MEKKSFKVVIIALVVALVIVVVGFFGYSYIQKDINGQRGTKTEATINLTSSMADYEIATKLKTNGIINNDTVWCYWMEKNSTDLELTSGEYYFSSSMSYNDIAEKLKVPDVDHTEVTIAIPEGYTVYQIANKLEENEVCSTEDFFAQVNNIEKYKSLYDFLSDVEYSDSVAFQLDGFLFPATYEWCKNMDATEIIEDMLNAFADRYTDEMKAKVKKSGYSLREILAVASVVQKEALGTESMANISSVFWNRISSPDYPMLQSDPTVAFAQKLKDNGFSEEVYTGYNTYKHIGIPVAPICNAGTEAIEATLNPNETTYYYFVTDANQKFYYATTWAEHVENCQKAGIN